MAAKIRKETIVKLRTRIANAGSRLDCGMHRYFRRLFCRPGFLLVALASAFAAPSLYPQHHDMGHMTGSDGADPHMMNGMMMPVDFGGISEMRDSSGTAWQPEDSPMMAHHRMLNDWYLMAHYNAFIGYDHQSGSRGDDQFNSINWLMLMAARQSERDQLTLRGMFSLEPWTTTLAGYPLLFQSGEEYHGVANVDRQHPHDFFMEVAARYRRILSNGFVGSLYVAPSGEPALGSPAFPHRVSAMDNPAAPISHHWLDSTHISFGVITAGVAKKDWQLEGSVFNGREPDDRRWNFDRIRLNSYATRLSWNPTENWSGQVSAGYLKSPEALHADENLHRYTASVIYTKSLGQAGYLAATAGWGMNVSGGTNSHATILEASWHRDAFTLFGRAEYVEKTAEELSLGEGHEKWGVKQFTVGASRELLRDKPYDLALGGEMTFSFAPSTLDRLYGDHPIGYWLFIRVRPAAMKMMKM